MKKLNLLFLAVLLAFAFGSCTMVKQHYSSGFYIHKNGKNASHEKTMHLSVSAAEPVVINEANADVVVASNSVKTETGIPNAIPNPVETSTKKNSPVKQTIQQFKKIGIALKNNATQKSKVCASHWVKKQSTLKTAAHPEGKSQIVALLLCLFLGFLGVHRFYLGYTGMGLLYLFTLGLFGIGWLIDIILLIIPNGLTPKGQDSY